MKKQEKQKQKIKEVLLKILHIVSYVLALLFIVICIVTGVQSCSKKDNSPHRVSRPSELGLLDVDLSNYQYIYTSNYNGRVALDVNKSDYLLMAFDISLDSYTFKQGNEVKPIVYEDLNLYYNDNFIKVNSVDYIFDSEPYTYSSNDVSLVRYRYRLFAIKFYLADNTEIYYVGKVDTENAYDYVYDFSTELYLMSSQELKSDILCSFFFSSSNYNTSFIFNEKINYNAPFGYLGKNPLISQNKWEELPHIDNAPETAYIDTCLFVCNGKMYNRILLYGHDAYKYYYHFGDNLLQYTLDHSLKFVEFIAYMNSYEGYSSRLWVWSREVSNDYQGKYVIEDNGYWKSQLYRSITLVGPSDNDLISFTQFNTDLDLYNGGLTFYDSDNVGIGSAFSLMRQAFGSLIDIMNISILPGLTLGVFIFLPLIATIIVLVFRAVRK